MSSTAKYGSENESPGPLPRVCTPSDGDPAVSASRHLALRTLCQLDPEQTAPEAQRPLGIIGRKLDQRQGRKLHLCHDNAAGEPNRAVSEQRKALEGVVHARLCTLDRFEPSHIARVAFNGDRRVSVA